MKKTIISFVVLSLISANAHALSFARYRIEGKPGVSEKIIVKNDTVNKVFVKIWAEKEVNPMTLADIAGIKNPAEYANGIQTILSPRMVHPEVLAQIAKDLTKNGEKDPYGIVNARDYIKDMKSLEPSNNDTEEIKARKAVLNKISDEIEVKKAKLKAVAEGLPSCADSLMIRPMNFSLEPDEPKSVSVKSAKAGYCRIFFEDRKAPIEGDKNMNVATQEMLIHKGLSVRLTKEAK